MDSDLSLIEIAGEDDSLLQPISGAGDAVSSLGAATRSDYFFCSPLQVPRSNSKPIEGVAVSEGLEESKRLLYKDSANKENLNVEKAEVLKLSIEPQQMKRKKKFGGYNLRKSLAWDRAFFTEEGVLDATELSMISGSFSKSNGQMLSAIEEQALEDNLFKELPSTTLDKTKKNSGSLLPNKGNKEASTSVASRKVLSTRDVNRSGSKRSASARPVASASLKRPANLVSTKTNSKVSKLPVQKPSPSAPAPSRTGKNSTLSASDSKRSQITRPAVNSQKNCGLMGSLNKSKNAPNNSKAGKASTNKTSLGQAKRNASSVKCFPNTEQLPLNTGAKSDLGVIPNQARPTGFPSNFHDGESGKIAIPLPQNMQHSQTQTERPTGLRRPSPSLGFFGQQSKAPTSPSSLKLISQPCNVPEASISNLRTPVSSTSVFALKPPLAPRSFQKVTNYGTTSSGCSVFSAVKPALHERMESNSQVADMQRVEKKVVSDEKIYEAIQSQNKLQGGLEFDQKSLGKAGQYTTKLTFEKEDINLLRNDDCLLQHGTLQQLDKNDTRRKVVDGSKESRKRSESENLHFNSHLSSAMEATGPLKSDITDNQLAEDKPHHLPLQNHAVSSEFTSINCSVKETLAEQAEVVNLCEADPTSSGSQMVQESVADVSSNVQVSGVAEIEKLKAFSDLRPSTEQERDDTSAFDKVATQASTEDTGVPSLDNNVTVDCSNNELNPLVNTQYNVAVSDVTQKPELVEFPESFLTRVEALEDGFTLPIDDCLFGETSIVPEEAVRENVPPTDERERTGACVSEPKSFSDPSRVPVTLLDCESNMAELVECQKQEDSPVVENHNLDTQFQHDIGLHDETTLMELGNSDDHLTNVMAAEDNVSGHEISNVSSSQSPLVCGSSINHTVEHADVEDIKLDSSVESPCPGPTSQPVDNFCRNQEDSPMVQVCVSSAEEDVKKQHEDEDNQMIPCFSDIDRISYEEKQCTEANGLLFEYTHSLEEPQKLENGNSATVYPEVRSHERSEWENHDLSINEKLDHVVEELVEVNDVIEDQDEDFEFQYLVNQTQEDATTTVVGVGVKNQPSQEDHNAEVFNNRNELVLQNPGDDGIEKMDNTAEVLNVENDFERVLEQHDDYKIEPKISTSVAQVAPEVQGIDLEEHKEAGIGSLEVESVTSVISSLETELPVVEQLSPNHENENNILTIEANSSRSDLREKQSDNEVSGKSTLGSECKDATRDHKKSGIDKKQDNLVIKPPINAVPFSDEWLAAIEAAGEEILTMKSGAVQNSPEDRSQPQPGPWSPVKRKHNQAIGPFDCTKHTNH